MAEMTITRALAEIKMLDKRINKTINGAVFAGYTIGKKPMTGFHSVDEIESKAKSDYQSIQDLINRRNKIKSAIVVSNAHTSIDVAGVKMTVAEAIERKTSIKYEKELLDKMMQEYHYIVNRVDDTNEEVKQRLDKHLETLYGKEGKLKASENEEIIKPFLRENEAKMVDPLHLRNKIDMLANEIETFEMEVDFSLAESNTLTKITIED